MWDSRCVTTLYLVPDRKEEIVVRKITEKVSDDPDDQELYHDETLAWVPEGTSAKDLNLMTAAPELLEALQQLVNLCEENGLHPSKKAYAAITKATGE